MEEVEPAEHPEGDTVVRMACLDDDANGQRLEVFWEREVDAQVLGETTWDTVGQRGFDDPQVFGSYLNTLRWNCVTSTDPGLFQSPLRAGIDVKPYQLEPLRKALRMPRVSLFIADDVGLGKTIEAGLILRELLLRQKVHQVVVIAPPSVVLQWKGEMESRFGLGFAVMDRAYISEMRRQRAQAAAERDIARARLDRLVTGARREELAQARAQLARAQAAHDKAREDDARARAGLAAQTITVAEASQAAAAARQARAQLDEARAAHALLVAGTRREELAEARAQLARAEAALEAAEDQLAYAAIRAPIDGTVIRRGIEVGEMVSPGVSATAQGTSMLTIADLDRLVIKSALNQVDIGKVVLAQRVDVRVDAAPGKVFAGSIFYIHGTLMVVLRAQERMKQILLINSIR